MHLLPVSKGFSCFRLFILTPRLAWPLLEGPQYGEPSVSLARQSGNLQNPSSDGQWKGATLERHFGCKKHQVFGVLELAKVANVANISMLYVTLLYPGIRSFFKTTIAFNYHQNHNFSSANVYQEFVTDSSSFEPHTLQGTNIISHLGKFGKSSTQNPICWGIC